MDWKRRVLGDFVVTNEDIKKWKPLVKKISYRYKNNPYKLELEDIEQIGYIGLIRGLKNFDSTKGTKLINHLYNYIKWSIDREIRDLKLDKRCALHQSISLDTNTTDDDGLTIVDTLIDLKADILEAVTEGLLILDYKEQIKKTLTDPIDIDIALKVLFNDLSLEQVSKVLGINVDDIRLKYRSIREKLRRNMFIRSRYREYIRNVKQEKYKNIDHYKKTEYVAFNTIDLEESLLKLI